MAVVGQPRTQAKLPGRPQPRGKRPDPARRHADGVTPLAKLDGQDPNRSYVWVPQGDKNAISTYNHQGYKVERYVPGGVRPQGTSEDLADEELTPRKGDFVTGPYGCLLMSCPKERKAEIDEFGPDGSSGQRDIDRIEQHIVANRGGMDPLRGMRGLRRDDNHEYLTVEKEISRLAPEDGREVNE